MMNIRFCVSSIHIGCAIRIEWGEVKVPSLVAKVDDAMFSEDLCVTTITCRHNTVKHVHSSFYTLKQVDRCAHAHQIARLVGRQNAIDHLYHLIHYICRFANSQTANGIAVSPLAGYILCRTNSQFLVSATLHDRKKAL